MKNLIERIEALLQQLAPRERVMVLLGAAAVGTRWVTVNEINP